MIIQTVIVFLIVIALFTKVSFFVIKITTLKRKWKVLLKRKLKRKYKLIFLISLFTSLAFVYSPILYAQLYVISLQELRGYPIDLIKVFGSEIRKTKPASLE